jgi:hypothetical protein
VNAPVPPDTFTEFGTVQVGPRGKEGATLQVIERVPMKVVELAVTSKLAGDPALTVALANDPADGSRLKLGDCTSSVSCCSWSTMWKYQYRKP